MENNSETKQYEIIEDIEQTKSSEIVNQKELETKAIDTIVALVNQANNIASENSSVEERKKYDEVKNADTLDFKWLDLEEKDERTIKQVLDDMQAESDGIAEAVTKLKELLGDIDL